MKKLNIIITILKDYLSYGSSNWNALISKLSVLESQLLLLVINDPEITDEKAAEELFNTNFKNSNYQQYRRSLTEKLTNEILLYQPSIRKNTSYERVQIRCEQQYSIVKILRGKGFPRLTKSIATSLIAKVKKYQFTEIRVGINDYLVYYYSFIEPNDSKIKEYYNDLMLSSSMREAELFAQSNFNVFASKFNLNSSLNKSLIFGNALDVKKQLDEFKMRGENSHKFNLQYYSFCTALYKGKEEFDTAIEYARKGYEYVLKLEFKHPKPESYFLKQLSNFYLRKGYILEAHQTIVESIKLQKIGTNNWFFAIWSMVQIELSQRNYSVATEYFEQLINNKKFSNQATYVKNHFSLGGTYFLLPIRYKEN